MGERYRVKVTPYAEGAAREIGQYIAVKLCAPQSSVRTLTMIRKEIQSLRAMPARIALTPEEPWRSLGVHRMLVKNFYVYFWIDETERVVHVINIVYAGRDQKAQLSRMDKKETER